MSVTLLKPVAAYFEGNDRFDVDAMLAPFAADAVVTDERRTHRGHAAIRAWIEEATVGNKAIATPQSVSQSGDEQTVIVQVAGAFPGSPITLTFRFTVVDGRIARLEIG